MGGMALICLCDDSIMRRFVSDCFLHGFFGSDSTLSKTFPGRVHSLKLSPVFLFPAKCQLVAQTVILPTPRRVKPVAESDTA